MNTVTVKIPLRVLLDTNILVSAIVFSGKPGKILALALDEVFQVITSAILLAELFDVINKKFPLSLDDFKLFEKQTEKTFEIVSPIMSITLVRDDADNRVLEAAVEGKCSHIITGDKELLRLGSYNGIKILTCDEFLKLIDR